MQRVVWITVLVPALLLLAPTAAQDDPELNTLFFPAECRKRCNGSSFNVTTDQDPFEALSPTNGTAAFVQSRASKWAITTLRLVRTAVKARSKKVPMSPPAVARFLGGYSLAVYQAFAVWSEYLYAYGRYFQPVSSDMLNLRDASQASAEWDNLAQPADAAHTVFPGYFAPPDTVAQVAQEAAISGAASQFLRLFFCNGDKTVADDDYCNAYNKEVTLNATMAGIVASDKATFPIPFQQGVDIATKVFEQLQMKLLLQDTPAMLQTDPNKNIQFTASNYTKDKDTRSQPTPAVHDCSRLAKLGGIYYWQRLTLPKRNESKVLSWPNKNPALSPFPGDIYTFANEADLSFQNYAGQAATKAPLTLRATSQSLPMLLDGLNGPPGGNLSQPDNQTDRAFKRAMREVLQQSASLDDAKKAIVEFWADGPETTFPPGHWYKIAIQESNPDDVFFKPELDVLDRTMWTTFLVGLSLAEAGMLSWDLKQRHFSARPITGIQCGLGWNPVTKTSRTGWAWRGPYMGVGRRNLSTWQPFNELFGNTPAFPGYLSGHATFSGAAAEALRQTRSGFSTTFASPQYNCWRTLEGQNPVEPRIRPNKTGYVPNVTDVPNTGSKTVGYSPARDIVTCWEKYDDAARQAADSRIYGGIHINIDSDDGLKLGKRIGETVAGALGRLSPANYAIKEPVQTEVDLPGFKETQTKVTNLTCPPGTFVRIWDGRHDAGGLYALAVTCSDGTLIGTLGNWGMGLGSDDFMEYTESDGYIGLSYGLNSDKSVVAIAFKDRNASSDAPTPLWYGAQAATNGTVRCYPGERIVGLTTRTTTGNIGSGTGNIGTFGVQCGKVTVEDVTERKNEVPADPESGLWRYHYTCPEGTFITRFFGMYSNEYVNTLTAQCGRTWNLKTVGIPQYARQGTVAYANTSVEGFSGVSVNANSGSLDSIQFITFEGLRSPTYGKRNVPADTWTDILCDNEGRVIGILGWQDAYVSSIGLICGGGAFQPVVTSVKWLRMLRNPEHKLRIPGRPVIANTTSEVVAASALVLPATRIRTHVTGTARKGRMRASQPPATAIAQQNAQGASPTDRMSG